jgi:hypothetical protein
MFIGVRERVLVWPGMAGGARAPAASGSSRVGLIRARGRRPPH